MATKTLDISIEGQIEKVLEEIRPMLALHRGNVEFLGFKNGIVSVRLLGTCHGCPLSELTLKAGIEEMLKSSIHGIKSIEAVGEPEKKHAGPVGM